MQTGLAGEYQCETLKSYPEYVFATYLDKVLNMYSTTSPQQSKIPDFVLAILPGCLLNYYKWFGGKRHVNANNSEMVRYCITSHAGKFSEEQSTEFAKYTEDMLNGLYHRMLAIDSRACTINPDTIVQRFGSIDNFNEEVRKKRNM